MPRRVLGGGRTENRAKARGDVGVRKGKLRARRCLALLIGAWWPPSSKCAEDLAQRNMSFVKTLHLCRHRKIDLKLSHSHVAGRLVARSIPSFVRAH